jgi:membrane associated rhomboid family serine protease
VWIFYELPHLSVSVHHANGGGTAFFAHIGGFLFGIFVARLLAGVATREPATAAPRAWSRSA